MMRPNRQSNPFFSPLGCGTTLIVLVGLGLGLFVQGGRPFSPGELTAAQTRGTPVGGVANHAAIAGDCQQCHLAWRGIAAERCEQCHTAVAGQRQTGDGLHGRFQENDQCQLCHTDHQGAAAAITQISLSQFDHERSTTFSLNQHQVTYTNVPLVCADCHQAGEYTAVSVECQTCHASDDAAFMKQHTTLFGADCLACHDGLDSMAQFDHTLVFVLDGSHTTVECLDCHLNQTFREEVRACAACHGEPTVHAGQFGVDCVRCHTSGAWTPAQLTGHIFPLDHGRQVNSDCTTCHIATYSEYSCYGCHDHTEAAIKTEHLDEGISDFADCAACHPTGREEEGEQEHDE